MTDEQNQELEALFKQKFNSVRSIGIVTGASAVAGVVCNMISTGKSKHENPALTLGKINSFCKTSLAKNETARKKLAAEDASLQIKETAHGPEVQAPEE